MKHKNYKKIIITSGLVVVLLAAGGVVYVARHHHRAVAVSTADGINYNPPTADEKKAGDTQKQTDVNRQDAIDQAKGTTPTAQVVVSDASYYPHDGDVVEVRGYVSNVIEAAGTCTATFTKDAQTVTQTSSAFKDATTTQCSTIDVPRSKFSVAGDWQLVLAYSSTTTTGQAARQTVAIGQ